MRRLLRILILATFVVGPATAYVPDTLTVTFLDVGLGDSILVQAPNGHAMLVDDGESSAASTVSTALAGEGISRLDDVVATHDHADHIGGMLAVLPQVTVGQFVSNGVPASTQPRSTSGITSPSAVSRPTRRPPARRSRSTRPM